MKKHPFSKLHTFLVGASVGMGIVSLVLLVLVLSGQIPWLKAAGVGTGAPDINAGHLDGYGTSLSAGTSKIYISDSSNYLPDSIVDTGAIVDGTIVTGDIATDTILAADIAAGAIGQSEIAAGAVGTSEIVDDSVSITADLNLGTDGTDSGLDADLVDGHHYSSDWETTHGTIVCGTWELVVNVSNNCDDEAPAGYDCLFVGDGYDDVTACSDNEWGSRTCYGCKVE